jgi:flagellar basal-body rod protein FlgC
MRKRVAHCDCPLNGKYFRSDFTELWDKSLWESAVPRKGMSIARTIAISGLHVAELRLQVSASNLANMRSDGPLPGVPNTENFPPVYAAMRVNQTENVGSGTNASVAKVSPASLAAFDPSAPFADDRGMIASPNVDLANEIVQVLLARFGYAANAKVIHADAQMAGVLLDLSA